MKSKILFLVIFLTSFSAVAPQAPDSLTADPDPMRYQSEIDQYQEWDQKNTPPPNAILLLAVPASVYG